MLKCRLPFMGVLLGLALFFFSGRQVWAQFTQSNFKKPQQLQGKPKDFWSSTPTVLPEPTPEPVNNDPTVQIENPEIEQTGFFPPERSLFPDTSPGRLMGNGMAISPEDDAVTGGLPWVWGGVGARAIPTGQKMAPNGVMYNPVFSLDLELNMSICKDRSVYLFSAARFWGQRAMPGFTTNSNQGSFDFSKRQLDFTVGAAWNYWRTLEIRGFAYSYNNLNRGSMINSPISNTKSSGYNDGAAVEHRWYYFDSCFLGVGYAPTKELIGNDGLTYKPGWFLTSSIWAPLWDERNQVYWNSSLIGENTGSARMLYCDVGYACVPFLCLPRLEFRTGTELWCDLTCKTLATYYIGLDVPF